MSLEKESHVRRRSILFSLPLAVLCCLVMAASAAAHPPYHKAYNCYGIVDGNLNYTGSFELISSTRYLWAADYAGTKLKGKKHKAKYKLHGDKLKFRTGPYKPYLGLYIRKSKNGNARVNLYRPNYKSWTGISCDIG
jgi:hypothetical protein